MGLNDIYSGAVCCFKRREIDSVFPKGSTKPLAMLKALIALGGKEVEEEQISDILWPDADGDMAHQSWATNFASPSPAARRGKGSSTSEGRLTLDTTIAG